jgi:hypothetical protein
LPILSDYASVFIIWKLSEKYGLENKFWIAMLCCLNPVNFFISDFHGNTDPIFICLVLWSVYLFEQKKIVYTGIVYGLSLCIKIVPVILFPVYLAHIRNRKDKISFIIGMLIIPSVVFIPYLINDYHSIIKNVFQYGSLHGIWGIGHLLKFVVENENIYSGVRKMSYYFYNFHVAYGTLLYFSTLLTLLISRRSENHVRFVEDIFLAFGLFLVMTPGFGIQYLSWFSFFAIIVFYRLGFIYTCCGGLFLYRVYTYWSGGFPMNYANSNQVGQWVGFEKVLDIILWLIMCIMLAAFLFRKSKKIVRE